MRKNIYNLEYQMIIENVISKAVQTYPRLFVVRCDLRYPLIQTNALTDSAVITRFIASLKAKIIADVKRKETAWGRRLSCVLNYVWVREFGDENGKKHYHVMLFFNKDIYYNLGNLAEFNGNLSAMIRQAWCSAIRLNYYEHSALVHFGRVHYIDRNSTDHLNQRYQVSSYASYLAKLATKRSGDGERNIGSSG